MSDPNPPEQPSFNNPPPSEPTAPIPAPPVGSAGPVGGSAGGGAVPPPPPPPAPGPSQSVSGAAAGAVQSGANAVAEAGTGFLPALFDFSFNSFVTPKIVKFVYVLATIWIAIIYALAVITGFTQGIGTGLAALVIGPLFAIIWLAVVRIGLEFGISVVRMSEDIHRRLPQG